MVVQATGTSLVGAVGPTRSGEAEAASALGREQVFFHTSNKDNFVSKLLMPTMWADVTGLILYFVWRVASSSKCSAVPES